MMPVNRDCFRVHIIDAIRLNMERADRYDALSGGASRPITRNILFNQVLILPAAMYFDCVAKRYQAAEVALFCDEFVDMTKTPAFAAHKPPTTGPDSLPPLDVSGVSRAIRRAYADGAFEGVKQVASRELEQLGGFPDYLCMTRHLLESIYRFAYFAVVHERTAQDRGIESPAKHSWALIKFHLWGLKKAAVVDALAIPLQAKGIPILAQDVPALLADIPLVDDDSADRAVAAHSAESPGHPA